MAKVNFDTLWINHPALASPPEEHPCRTNGVSNHKNQCAIRLGVCLTASGISLATYSGVCCWSGHGRRHPLRVEQLKLWLNGRDASFVGEADISKRTKRGMQRSSHWYAGKRGIVACINFWGRGNQGDHIDLWDGTTMAQGGLDYFERSQEIWFWEMA